MTVGSSSLKDSSESFTSGPVLDLVRLAVLDDGTTKRVVL